MTKEYKICLECLWKYKLTERTLNRVIEDKYKCALCQKQVQPAIEDYFTVKITKSNYLS